MAQLAGLLPMVPLNLTPEAIDSFLIPETVNDFLSKRRTHRRAAHSKSGSAANADLMERNCCQAPLSGQWSGTCKECRSCTFHGQQITYCLSFKPCGAIEGTGSFSEGDFVIKGVYNMAKGIVSWCQTPLHSDNSCEHESELTAEFVGELHLSLSIGKLTKRASIVGSFLTTNGDYYSVALREPEIQPQNSQLPTLLTGGTCVNNVNGVGTPKRFYSKNSHPTWSKLPDDMTLEIAAAIGNGALQNNA
eukprot:gnl/MRDRNA2_/MRDRNA2_95503_c0_seq1.p1 gnl/MRDRNA2_/MRDRNA2_95503_c0~~gnl/MRDRNA2_/MRDRNA2_95503_c0_seq1.p1  ORF type:complete len:248 (+),score=30.02 gnl/MRDRNA2_/MRDRNA2_95503_c0_seq1:67-810(+)